MDFRQMKKKRKLCVQWLDIESPTPCQTQLPQIALPSSKITDCKPLPATVGLGPISFLAFDRPFPYSIKNHSYILYHFTSLLCQ